MKRLLALIVVSMFSMGTLTACNTMAGAGKDVQKVGEKVRTRPRTARTPSADSGNAVKSGAPSDAMKKGRYIRPFFLLAM